MKPRSFFFVTVPMYHYNCTMTNAQLELIAADKPVSYLKKEKKKMGKPTKNAVREAIERYKAKQNK